MPPLSPETGRGGAIAHCRALISGEMKRLGIPGLSIVVADAEGELWAAGFGKADKKAQAFGADSLSNIGSVSKLFTATAVMILVERGKVDLDAPVSRYLPGFNPRSWGPSPDGITVRSLLCHESGLQSDYLEGMAPGGSFVDQPPRPYAGNAELASDTTICHPPFTVFSYSNLGYSLLGLVVESVSGMGFNDFVVKEVLAPIGMDSSSFEYRRDLAGRYAKGPSGGSWIDAPALREQPAGSLTSSASDMGKFLTAVLRTATKGEGRGKGGILDPRTLKEMWARQNGEAALDFDFSVGLGWWPMVLRDLPGSTLYGHGGDWPPFTAFAAIDPELGIGVAVLANGAVGSYSLVDIVAGTLRAFALSEKGLNLETGLSVKNSPEAPLPAGLAEKLEGNWISPILGLLKIRRSGTGLAAIISGLKVDLPYHGGGEFSLRLRILGIVIDLPSLRDLSFSAAEYLGEDYLLLRTRGVSMGTAEKLEPEEIDPAWLSRLGKWIPLSKPEKGRSGFKSVELLKDGDSGLYVARVDGIMDYPFASRGPDEIFIRGYGRNLGTEIQAYRELDGSERINVMGVVLRKKK